MIMIVVGGITYATSDVFSQKSNAKETITNALIGLLIVISSYMILYTVNPDLLSFNLRFDGLQGAEWGSGVVDDSSTVATAPRTKEACDSWGGKWESVQPDVTIPGLEVSVCTGGTAPNTGPSGPVTSVSANVASGIALLNSQAQARPPDDYGGKCALFVRQALSAEGYTSLDKDHPVPAAAYGPFLTNIGFTSVAQNSQSNYSPQVGDVAVIQPPPRNDPSEGNGHIAIYNGSQWVSDTRQSQMLPARAPTSPWQSSLFTVYRPKS